MASQSTSPLRVLWISTKLPWPPADGGRRLMLDTLRGLAERELEIELVAPGDPGQLPSSSETARPGVSRSGILHSGIPDPDFPRLRTWPVAAKPRPLPLAAALALLRGWPLTVARHALPAVRRAVHARIRSALAAHSPLHVAHAEQVQALWAAGAATIQGLPLLLHAQNVESDLWQAAARGSLHRRWLLGREGRRLAQYEGRAVRNVGHCAALTVEDATRLGQLAGDTGSQPLPSTRLPSVLPAPFPEHLPYADEALPGSPAVVLFGSSGWLPNRQGEQWFLDQVWPLLRQQHPQAQLHIYGGDRAADVAQAPEAVQRHPAPKQSRLAFAPGAVLAVPLFIASGVRIKILESWARGVPVVATSAAARGLGAEHQQQLLIADGPEAFAESLSSFARDHELGPRLVAGGRALLRQQHSPRTVAAQLEALYRGIIPAP